jgi:hypothetical protein
LKTFRFWHVEVQMDLRRGSDSEAPLAAYVEGLASVRLRGSDCAAKGLLHRADAARSAQEG